MTPQTNFAKLPDSVKFNWSDASNDDPIQVFPNNSTSASKIDVVHRPFTQKTKNNIKNL